MNDSDDSLDGTPSRVVDREITFSDDQPASSVADAMNEIQPRTAEPAERNNIATSNNAVNSDHQHDDNSSIGSSVSQIAGTWWFGKQTKYVPHCERRHLPEKDSAPYLTPTQRKAKENGQLKQRLDYTERILMDKEKHLTQLRERLSELETILETNGSLMENHRLNQRSKQLEKQIAKVP